MPAASTTARTEPPAMTPVPCEAGLSSTVLAPNCWVTSCGMVVPTIGTLIRCFFASSTPLRMASGTSPALPRPDADMAGAVADDDDRAEAEAAAALDDFGDAVDLDDALFERQPGGIDPGQWFLLVQLEVEAGFARGVGQRADAAVVAEAGAIEDDLLDAGGAGALGEQLADQLGLLGLGALRRAHAGLERGGGGKRLARRCRR